MSHRWPWLRTKHAYISRWSWMNMWMLRKHALSAFFCYWKRFFFCVVPGCPYLVWEVCCKIEIKENRSQQDRNRNENTSLPTGGNYWHSKVALLKMEVKECHCHHNYQCFAGDRSFTANLSFSVLPHFTFPFWVILLLIYYYYMAPILNILNLNFLIFKILNNRTARYK